MQSKNGEKAKNERGKSLVKGEERRLDIQKNRLYSMLTFGPLNAGVTVLGSIMVTALKYLDPT